MITHDAGLRSTEAWDLFVRWLQEQWATSPLVFDNETEEQANQHPTGFVRVIEEPVGASQLGQGQRRVLHEASSLIQLRCHVPLGQRTGLAKEWAEALSDILRGFEQAWLEVGEPYERRIGPVGDFFVWDCLARVDRTELISKV